MGRRVLLFVAFLAALVGGVLLWWGLSNPTFEEAPLPKSTFVVSNPESAGPTKAPVVRGQTDAGEMTPEKMAPNHIFIPAIGVYAPFSMEHQDSGKMTLPTDLGMVGLNTDAAALDSQFGTVLVSSHVSWHRQDGPLHDLYQLAPGNSIYTTDADGARTQWLVAQLGMTVKSNLPQSFFSSTGKRRLVAVTCGGPAVQRGAYWIHRDNVWVVAYPAF